ncbi:DUF6777 domain-containing protein [Mycolicibacterium sp.]|uniref:DUF6777 domain-containing protein n=1 Tax=Mycolicibacterium sp. TaxID=2320850 RepID=UPI0037C8ABB6
MTDPHARWVDPNPPDPTNPRTTAILAVSGVALTLVVMATLVWVVLARTDRDGAGPVTGEAVAVAANVPLDRPFTDSVLVAPVSISDQVVSKAATLLQQIPVRVDRGVRPVSGRQPELYGATGETLPCDVATLANYLDADAGAARAWGLALGLTPAQIPFYLNTLTPVVLTADTWVTAHGLADGAARPRQAVLQAGTAVLVDPLGVPRVQCAAGAPLAPPDDDNLAKYRITGTQWQGFALQDVLAVKYGPADSPHAADEFVLLDVTTGQQVNRAVGGVIDLGAASTPLPDPAVMNIAPDAPVPTTPKP